MELMDFFTALQKIVPTNLETVSTTVHLLHCNNLAYEHNEMSDHIGSVGSQIKPNGYAKWCGELAHFSK